MVIFCAVYFHVVCLILDSCFLERIFCLIEIISKQIFCFSDPLKLRERRHDHKSNTDETSEGLSFNLEDIFDVLVRSDGSTWHDKSL